MHRASPRITREAQRRLTADLEGDSADCDLTQGRTQPDSLTLTAGKAEGKFNKSMPLSYQFQISTDSGSIVSACTGTVTPDGGAATVSYSPSCGLDFDAPYKWKVRARNGDYVGPWSSDASFKTPTGGYIRGNEVFDPLTNGKTAGESTVRCSSFRDRASSCSITSATSRYRLPVNLQARRVLDDDSRRRRRAPKATRARSSRCRKAPTKGHHDDDYRFTAELRGANYGAPGSVTYRIIAGDGVSRDGARSQLNFNSTRWYFWRFSWQTGSARLEVREDSRTGQTIYSSGIGTGSHPYRPDPHYLYLGSPIGRAGALDATLPGGIYKNVWASSRPRPAFPN